MTYKIVSFTPLTFVSKYVIIVISYDEIRDTPQESSDL